MDAVSDTGRQWPLELAELELSISTKRLVSYFPDRDVIQHYAAK